MKRTLLLLAVVALSACGGGGGGGSSAPTPVTPASTPTPAAVTPSDSVQRTLVQQALSSTTQAQQVASYGTSSSTLAHLRRALSGERAQQAVCEGGVATTVTAGSASNIANVTIDAYYDLGCTKLWYVGVGTLTATSATAGTLNIAYTYYTIGGSVYRYATATLALSGVGTGSGSFSIAAAIATAPGAAPFVNVGLGCTISPTSDGCSGAEVDHLAGLGIDDGIAIAVNAGLSVANGSVTVSVSGNGSANTGSLNSIGVVAQGATGWTISGGTQLDAASVSGSLTLSGAGVVTAGNLSVSDARDGASVTASYNPSTQTIGGTVLLTATGATVATFTVNVSGSGTVAYADGTTGTISNWVVQS